MTNTEKELFSAVPANEFNTYWIPCTWFIYRLKEAAKRNKLLNPYALETIMREFCEFRAKCGLLWCYDWVSIPMVYTQVSQWDKGLLYNLGHRESGICKGVIRPDKGVSFYRDITLS